MTARNRTTVLTVVSAMILSICGLAVAQEATTVSTVVADGDRHLTVTDVAGTAKLTDMSLVPGVPRTFRVNVEDDLLSLAKQRPFDVVATMNNLYLTNQGGYDWTRKIPSEDITVSYATNPLGVKDLLAQVRPSHLLEVIEGALTCAQIASALGLSVEDILGLDLSTVIGLLEPVQRTALQALCDLTGDGLAIPDVEVLGELLPEVDLDSLITVVPDLGALPIIPAVGETGRFLQADYSGGIGQGDAAGGGAAGTPIKLMTGRLNTNALDDLTTLVESVLAGVPLVGAGGTGQVDVAEVLAALADGASTEVAAAVDLIGQLGLEEQLSILNGVLSSTLQMLGLEDLFALSGVYHTLPRLEVDTAAAPTAGSYAGTMTVTLVNLPKED